MALREMLNAQRCLLSLQILDMARQRDKRVKVVGGGHSPSDIACTDDFMIQMGKMNRVLKVRPAAGRWRGGLEMWWHSCSCSYRGQGDHQCHTQGERRKDGEAFLSSQPGLFQNQTLKCWCRTREWPFSQRKSIPRVLEVYGELKKCKDVMSSQRTFSEG